MRDNPPETSPSSVARDRIRKGSPFAPAHSSTNIGLTRMAAGCEPVIGDGLNELGSALFPSSIHGRRRNMIFFSRSMRARKNIRKSMPTNPSNSSNPDFRIFFRSSSNSVRAVGQRCNVSFPIVTSTNAKDCSTTAAPIAALRQAMPFAGSMPNPAAILASTERSLAPVSSSIRSSRSAQCPANRRLHVER